MASSAISIRVLTPADVAACAAVEAAAFPNPDHRASADKFAYRLHVCPELCLGAFAAAPAGGGGGEPVLVAHIVGTRCHGPVVTDASMAYPPAWRTAGDAAAAAPADASAPAPPGHQPLGTTVAVHSLAVVPAMQKQGLGSQLMAAYLAQMRGGSAYGAPPPPPPVARVSLLCQEHLVGYYAKLGFALLGPSAAQFGGGGWFDMFYDLTTKDTKDTKDA